MLYARNAISDLESLKAWWDSQPEEYKLYSIFYGRGTGVSHVYARELQSTSKAESWVKLETAISSASVNGGDFTILAMDKPTNKSGPRCFVCLDPQRSTNHPAQINGYPAQIPQQSEAEIQRRIEEAVYAANLENQLAGMEAAIKEMNSASPLERMFERIAESPAFVPAINGLLAKLSGQPQTPPRSMAMAGFDEAEQDGTPQYEYVYDQHRLVTALEKIRVHFPDPMDLLERVADFIDKNPHLAKQYFQSPTDEKDQD